MMPQICRATSAIDDNSVCEKIMLVFICKFKQW